jgi:galactokinase/mevalonate kinase-like predicted kinase
MSRGPLVATAPARANLIGNPGDQYGGVTLSCTVPLRARVRITPALQGVLVRGQDEAPVGGLADLERRGDLFDLPRAALAHLGLDQPRCRIALESEVPLQSGLAGSTALLVALLAGLLAFTGRRLGPYALAETAREVERAGLGVQCGYVDQYLCVFGGLCYVDFRGKEHDAPAAKAPLATVERLSELVPELPFVLAFTGVRHSSDSVHRPIRERWLAGDPAVVQGHARVAELGLLGKKALLEGDWETLGALMNENHAIQRDLGGSGPSNEALIAAALGAGAAGAKLAGAGHGGTIVALWPDRDAAPLEAALGRAGATALYRPVPCPGVTVGPGT